MFNLAQVVQGILACLFVCKASAQQSFIKLGDGRCQGFDGPGGLFKISLNVETAPACESQCASDSACRAYEHQLSIQRCRLYLNTPSEVSERNNFVCFVKLDRTDEPTTRILTSTIRQRFLTSTTRIATTSTAVAPTIGIVTTGTAADIAKSIDSPSRLPNVKDLNFGELAVLVLASSVVLIFGSLVCFGILRFVARLKSSYVGEP